MKKIIKLMLVLAMCFCYFGGGLTITAYEINPIDEDIRLHGNEILERIVLYDANTGYINVEYIDELAPLASVPGGGGGGYASYFSKVEWILRDNGWALSLTPIKAIFKYDDAWNRVRLAFKDSTQWKNSGNSTVDSSMYNQYVCHYKIAGTIKTPWNLEPWKPDKGYDGFVNARCN